VLIDTRGDGSTSLRSPRQLSYTLPPRVMPVHRDDDAGWLERIEKMLCDIRDRTKRLEAFHRGGAPGALAADRVAAETAARDAARLAKQAKRGRRRKRYGAADYSGGSEGGSLAANRVTLRAAISCCAVTATL
jgi:hypothetical protein